MTRELRQADLDPARFQELLKQAAGGEDYRVIIPGVGVVRILPEPERFGTDTFKKLLSQPGVAQRLNRAAEGVRKDDLIADDEIDDVFHG